MAAPSRPRPEPLERKTDTMGRVSMVPENAREIRSLVAEFDRLSERKFAMFRDGSYTSSEYERLERDQLTVAYRLVGTVKGAIGE